MMLHIYQLYRSDTKLNIYLGKSYHHISAYMAQLALQ